MSDALVAEPTPAELAGWAAVRARLTITHPWLAAAVFRAVPVSLPTWTTASSSPPASSSELEGLPEVSADRWGRVYVDFTLEQRRGIAVLAVAVQEALLSWVSQQAPDRAWHAHRLDDRFPAVGASDTARAARQVAAGVASTSRPHFGSDPFGDWRPWAEKLAGPPQIPWQDQLGGLLRSAVASRAGHQVRTYSRPGRRQLPGVLVPAVRSPELNVAVVADISGSIADDLATVLAEVSRIADAVNVHGGAVTLYAVDDEVAAVHRGLNADVHLEPRKGHRTDLRPGFDAALATPRRPDVVVVLTDGMTPWPDTAPSAAAIVVLIGDRTVTEKAQANVPSWAAWLRVDTHEDT